MTGYHSARMRILLPLAATFLVLLQPSSAQEAIHFRVGHGFTRLRTISPEWKEAIRYAHTPESLDSLSRSARPLTSDELLWLDLITRQLPAWRGMADSLCIPFPGVSPPDTVPILLGNQGGNDAFVYPPSTICFDLARLYHEYGSASETMNLSRIDRFFAHEFTHVMHRAWARNHRPELRTPFEEALWDCLSEGLGHYRSLSDRWVTAEGTLTEHAQEVLTRLQLVFLDRLSNLKKASGDEARVLTEDLSMGRFDKKWGALTVALWLAQEAMGDDRNLRQWVEAGPAGIIKLAHKYLPDDLRGGLPSYE